MALTRKMLKAMGIEDEKIDQIIDAHAETVDALKNERDGYKADAEKLPEVQKKLDELEAKPDDGFKDKYEKAVKDLEEYRSEVAKEKADAERSTLYKALLTEAGVDPKRIDSVMRVADLESIAVKDGKIDGADKIIETVKTEWADFIVQTGTKGSDPANPPTGGGGSDDLDSLSDAEYYAKVFSDKK